MAINVTSPTVVARKRNDNTDTNLNNIRNKVGAPEVIEQEQPVDEQNFKIVKKSSAFLRDMLAEKK